MARKTPREEPEPEPRPEEPTFEVALARLEEIAHRLESEDLALEEAIGLAEEGQRLLALCEKQLAAAEARIQRLVERAGELALEPLEPEEAEDDSDWVR